MFNNQPRLHKSPLGLIMGIDTPLSSISAWLATPEGVRDACIRGRVVGTHLGIDKLAPALARRIAPTQDDVEKYAERANNAARAGRLIDFGMWSNDVIKHGGNRGGPMYTKGILGHPFRDDYLFMHGWNGSPDVDAVSVYLVTPLEPEKANGDCEAVELQPFMIGPDKVLALGDRLLLEPDMNAEEINYRKYKCRCIPAIWRYLEAADAVQPGNPENSAAGNVLDPLMTALLVLATRNIDRVTVEASPALQKARIRSGKPPIPSFDRVYSAPYVTAITAKIENRPRGVGLGGSHASPVPHLRMGHSRTYASGKISLVRDALVNFSEEARKSWLQGSRSHYVVKS